MARQEAPPSQAELSRVSDTERQLQREANVQKVLDRRSQILVQARARAAELLRGERGVQAPPSELTKPVAKDPSPPSAPAHVATQNADTVQLITQRLEAQAREAARLHAESQAVAARATAAEQKLEAFKANPALYLQDEGMSLDDWNARLVNGGEKTPEQKMMEAIEERLRASEARTQAVEQQLAQRDLEAKRATLLGQLTPVLVDRFPLVHKILGPNNVLDHLVQMQKKTPEIPVDSEKVLTELESNFITNLDGYLQDPKVAAKLSISALTSQAERVVNQGPRTMTNSVTSSVAPSVGRTTTAQKRAKANEFLRAMRAGRV